MARKNIILEEILKKYKNEMDNDSTNDDENFEFFSAEQLLKDENLDEEEIKSGLVGGGNDNGIDGFYIFLDDDLINQQDEVEGSYKEMRVYFHQYKNKYKIEHDVVLKFINAFQDILDFENEELNGWSSDIKEKIQLLRYIILNTAGQGIKIKFIINHVSKANSTDIKDDPYWNKVGNLRKVIENAGISRLESKYDFIGGNELTNLSYKKPEYSIDLLLKDSPITLDFGDNQIGYIALVSLKNYYNFIIDDNGSIRKHIFDSNVRDYQNKTAVNKGIESSIKENKNIDFWWLNNGITIIAGKESSQIGKKLSLKNVQIVNGLQTSYSIYNSLKSIDFDNFEDNRSVFVKIIICDQKDTVDKIIRATNSQNAVASGVLRATDDIQRDIEQYFFSKGYYYDRRKNYYKNLGKPRNKIISINLLSQCIVSLVLSEKNPSMARSNPTILIKKDEDYNKVFQDRNMVQAYLNSVLIYKAVDKELKRLITEKIFIENSDTEKVIKLLKFHIARVLISELTYKGNPIAADLQDEKIIKKINSETINKSIVVLNGIIDEYKAENLQSIDNISKQTGFSRFITKILNEKFKDK